MTTEEHKKRQLRGRWLEEFFKPGLKSWSYRQLAIQFIDIYCVDFKLSKNDKSIIFLKIIDEHPHVKNLLREHMLSPTRWDRYGQYFEKYECELSNLDITNFRLLFDIKNKLKLFFNDVWRDSKPWGDSFAADAWEYELGKPGCDPREITRNSLTHYYNGLVEHLSLGKHGLEHKTIFSSEYNESYPVGPGVIDNYVRPSIFPWGVAASRMFFDFLFLGGQDYFLFCPECGNFSVIERKGRKKFCSDICKTRYNLANSKRAK